MQNSRRLEKKCLQSSARNGHNGGSSVLGKRRLRLELLEQRALLTVSNGADWNSDESYIEPAAYMAGAAVSDSIESMESWDSSADALLSESATSTALDAASTFYLHSNPTAKHTIYLDFTGHTTTGTTWNSRYGSTITTPAWSLDSTPSFSTTELAYIGQVWQRVSEDFLPFDVDVTTQEPTQDKLVRSGSSDDAWGIRTVFGDSCYTWYGALAGGVAYNGSFMWSSDTPCFVFKECGQIAQSIAEAASHEIGHTLGLSHDGNASSGYHPGFNDNAGHSWAPIMGSGYGKSLTQWSCGEYAGATCEQDDLWIITNQNGFGYREDDHGNDSLDATYLLSSDPTSSGIIEQNTDQDYFRFTVDASRAGEVSILVCGAEVGSNLDAKFTLLDGSGTVLYTVAPGDSRNASLSTELTAGTYYLCVSGDGWGDPTGIGYSNYGSLGYYSVNITLPPESVPLPEAPTSLTAIAKNDSEIQLLWSAVTGATAYRVEYSSAATNGWISLGEVSTTTLTHQNLAETTTYDYRIFAVNATGMSATAVTASATTFANGEYHEAPATPASLVATSLSDTSIQLTWSPVSNAVSYQISRCTRGSDQWTLLATITNTSYSDTGLAEMTTYDYRVVAVDILSFTSEVAATASATTWEKVYPEGLKPATYSVSENAIANTIVGKVVPLKRASKGQTYTYALVQGDDYFTIDKTGTLKVRAGAVIDYEQMVTIAVVVQTSINGQITYRDTLEVRVRDVNEAPESIGIQTGELIVTQVNLVEGETAVGLLTATDPERQAVTHRLSGTDAKCFEVVTTSDGYQLRAKSTLDYENAVDRNRDGVYEVTVMVTDSGRKTAAETVYITIQDHSYNSSELVELTGSGTSWIVRQSDQNIQILNGNTIVFSEPVNAFPAVQIVGGAKNDTLTWQLDSLSVWDTNNSVDIRFDGAGGKNTVKVEGTAGSDQFLFFSSGVGVGNSFLTMENTQLLIVNGGAVGDQYLVETLVCETTISDNRGTDTILAQVQLDLKSRHAQEINGVGLTLKSTFERWEELSPSAVDSIFSHWKNI
ncbi:MAG: fibronectin type III domain-containing protein [Thermoguttaceae bacterium]|nr:fibronectin type III domain-containing protein [Thermoguttaceae bacterium]